MSEPVMQARRLVKRYQQGPREIVVLDELELVRNQKKTVIKFLNEQITLKLMLD